MQSHAIPARRSWIVLLIFLAFLLTHLFLVQPWFMRWGATDEELAMPLAGDPYIPPTTITSTRAITIYAPVDYVWRGGVVGAATWRFLQLRLAGESGRNLH